jgi:hypothetical protein
LPGTVSQLAIAPVIDGGGNKAAGKPNPCPVPQP